MTPTFRAPALAEKRVRLVTAELTDSGDDRSDLERRADALATLAGFVRRAFIRAFDSHTDV